MSLSRLVDGVSLVLDASSGLNLLGTGCAAEILRVLPHELVVTEGAFNEIERDPLSGAPGSVVLEQLMAAGLVSVVRLSEPAYNRYLSLVGAPSPDGLDDGEAATVAHAVDVGAVPVLDERKATRIAGFLCPLTPVCSLDLIAHPFMLEQLGETAVANAVYSALLHARMRVPEAFRPWVLSLVGAERLTACSSIPKRWLKAAALGNGVVLAADDHE